MTATVRIFSFKGVIGLPTHGNSDAAQNEVLVLKQPQLGKEVLSPDTSTAALSAAATAPSTTACLLVEVESGKTIGFEISHSGETPPRTADATSQRLSGRNVVHFLEGSRISVIEIA